LRPAGNPPNPLLKLRGNAGTHDMQLLLSTLSALRGQRPRRPQGGHGEVVGHAGAAAGDDDVGDIRIPRYDKSLRCGKGDRAPVHEWLTVSATEPVDVVLFEGWMLGFAPLAAKALRPYRYAYDMGGALLCLGIMYVYTC